MLNSEKIKLIVAFIVLFWSGGINQLVENST